MSLTEASLDVVQDVVYGSGQVDLARSNLDRLWAVQLTKAILHALERKSKRNIVYVSTDNEALD